MKNTENKCVLYIRAVTAAQIAHLEAHKKEAAEFAAHKGLVIVSQFTDG